MPGAQRITVAGKDVQKLRGSISSPLSIVFSEELKKLGHNLVINGNHSSLLPLTFEILLTLAVLQARWGRLK